MSKKAQQVISEYHLGESQPTRQQMAIYDLRSYLARAHKNASKPHIHSYYQIIWFKSGSGTHYVDFKSYQVTDNYMFFIAKDQVHYFDQNLDYDGYLIHFNETFLVGTGTDFDFNLRLSLFNNPFQHPSCCMNSGIDQLLDKLVTMMKEEADQLERFGHQDLLRAYLKSFLIHILRRRRELGAAQSNGGTYVDEKRAQLMRFVSLLDQKYDSGYTVTEYAAVLNVSTRTLSDLTNMMLGKKPSQMIQERVVLEAQRLLVHSSMNVNEIGYKLGFEDPSYFVKFFKKHCSQSPLEFRRSIS